MSKTGILWSTLRCNNRLLVSPVNIAPRLIRAYSVSPSPLATASRLRPQQLQSNRPLAPLPTSALFRSLLVLSVTALPSSIFNVLTSRVKRHAGLIESSRTLRWILMKTFYRTFCVGPTERDVSIRLSDIRALGISGVVLGYAREAPGSEVQGSSKLTADDRQLQEWVAGNLETVALVRPGDCIALKMTGAGDVSNDLLEHFASTTSEAQSWERAEELKILFDALHQICKAAKMRDVQILIDAETSKHQRGIEEIALVPLLFSPSRLYVIIPTTFRFFEILMAQYNRGGKALVYSTYQMYLKAGLEKLHAHLRRSTHEGFALGVKLVRGAYIHGDAQRGLICDRKQDTDAQYDAAVEMLLSSTKSDQDERVDLILASHNIDTVRKALAICKSWRAASISRTGGGRRVVQSLGFAQLMGMADEVTMELAASLRDLGCSGESEVVKMGVSDVVPPVRIYKYTTWGSLRECILYMVRRAEENRDAVGRSKVSRQAVAAELRRRVVRW